MGLRLLCVVAHPDDECFAFGGALALAAERGVETSVICLTDGQAATHRGVAGSGSELGRIRREEFVASCALLGVLRHKMLDHQDGRLMDEPLSRLVAELVHEIRRFRPHVVLTFGGDGALNTHPDHATVSAATTLAFHAAGHPKRFQELGRLWQAQRLFFLTTDFFMDGRHRPLPAPWTHTLDIRAVLAKKMEAFAAHTSQAPLLEQTRDMFAQHGNTEYYALAAAVEPQPATQSTDLFEGVSEAT